MSRARLVVGTATVALLAPLSLLPAHAGTACQAQGPVFPAEVPTLSVTVKAENDSYRRGQLATLIVDVHIAAPAGVKVQDVDVAVEVLSGLTLVKRLGSRTNKSGQARPRLKITTGMPTGKLTATAKASKELVPSTPCNGALVYQVGTGNADPLLTVKP